MPAREDRRRKSATRYFDMPKAYDIAELDQQLQIINARHHILDDIRRARGAKYADSTGADEGAGTGFLIRQVVTGRDGKGSDAVHSVHEVWELDVALLTEFNQLEKAARDGLKLRRDLAIKAEDEQADGEDAMLETLTNEELLDALIEAKRREAGKTGAQTLVN